MNQSEILINAAKIQNDIKMIERASKSLELELSSIPFEGKSSALEHFNLLYQRLGNVLSSYRTILNRDLQKATDAVNMFQKTDERIADLIRK